MSLAIAPVKRPSIDQGQAVSGYIETEIGVLPADWALVELRSIAKIKGGKRLPLGRSLVNRPTPHPYIRVSDMKDGSVHEDDLLFVPEDVFPAIRNYRIRKDDLYISVAGTLGLVGRVPRTLDGANLTENADRVTDISCNLSFLYYCLTDSRIQSEIEARRTVGAQPKLAIQQIERFKIPLPPTAAEQHAIAEALSDADALIASLDALIAKKRDLKQAAMQQLLTGKTRLPGFEGEWEEKLLADLLRVRHGKSQKGIESANGQHPILATGGEIGRTNTFLYDKPSVLIGRKGTIDDPQFVDQPFWTIDTLFYTEIAPSADPKFIFFKFKMIDWRSYNEASGVPSLSSRTIEGIQIFCPDKDEQVAIASVLSDMDDELAALEAKRDKARAIKQGMMQELLTGRIRLV